ncbi:polysaccharide deacetylase family protein [Gordonia otitidis]|uniref:Hydrolase n=1 Tax=Gordonia otitidis (strain DSM 44809 / CCUG 52243 / JCM 12355 / NBRC 100426 / IFM 10032) TaxID=1108044 RepID=H5TU72_GORO1|nr:polysaccharide deacetylase family protein [Gordonia otitidis]GAB37030.1 putative hydrolase [Gordonia otitidis NBRC 100426]
MVAHDASSEPAEGARHTVTLSFDNGPTEITSHVLDVLRDNAVAATFFVVGDKLQAQGRAVLERARTEGHWIGNHTMTHSVQLGTSADPHVVDTEIGQAQELLGNLTHPDKLFRPYGRGGVLDRRLLSPRSVRYLEQHSYTLILWNSISHDWDQPDHWVDRCLEDIERRQWSLAVLHDIPSGAMARLPEFFDRARQRGIKFTQDFPPSCVPFVRGTQRGSLDGLISG